MSFLLAIDHVQMAMPPGREEDARAFYAGILGLSEVPKPAELAKRGGCWFENARVKVHLGIERDFRASEKAHVALTITDLESFLNACRLHAIRIVEDEPLGGRDRAYIFDPFGNRIEVIAR